MKPFSKTYHTDKVTITIRIKRNEFCSMGCRLTIKDNSRCYHNRLVYDWFYKDKDMFRKYTRKMIEIKLIPRKIVDSIVEDIKLNLMFERVIVYQPIKTKMLWD
jgi:hypothetical protein